MAVHVLPLLRAAFTNPLPQSTNLMGIPFTTSFLFLPLMACDPNKPICQRAYRFTALYYFTNLSPIQVYIAISPPPNGPSGYVIFLRAHLPIYTVCRQRAFSTIYNFTNLALAAGLRRQFHCPPIRPRVYNVPIPNFSAQVGYIANYPAARWHSMYTAIGGRI